MVSLLASRRLSGAEVGPQFSMAHHGLSAFGDLAEKAGFAAFPYVEPNAPKGGTISQDVYGTFNSLNAYILRGPPQRHGSGFRQADGAELQELMLAPLSDKDRADLLRCLQAIAHAPVRV